MKRPLGSRQIEHDHGFRKLEKIRHEADFGLDYMTTTGEAEEACRLAKAFRADAVRIEKDGGGSR